MLDTAARKLPQGRLLQQQLTPAKEGAIHAAAYLLARASTAATTKSASQLNSSSRERELGSTDAQTLEESNHGGNLQKTNQ